LIRAVDRSEAAFVEALAKHKPAKSASAKLVDVRHPARTLASHNRIRTYLIQSLVSRMERLLDTVSVKVVVA
jgi:hypothetical protein